MKWANTRLGGASIRTLPRYVSGSAVDLPGPGPTVLDGPLETLEAGGPQLGEELVERDEPLGPDGVQVPAPLLAHLEQTRVSEDVEVLRDRLLRDVEVLSDLPGRAWLVTHEPQDRKPTGFGEGPQRALRLHSHIIGSETLDRQAVACANTATQSPFRQS